MEFQSLGGCCAIEQQIGAFPLTDRGIAMRSSAGGILGALSTLAGPAEASGDVEMRSPSGGPLAPRAADTEARQS